MMVDRAAQDLWCNRPVQIEMRSLAKRMHACIGATRAVDGDLLAAEPGESRFERLLHR